MTSLGNLVQQPKVLEPGVHGPQEGTFLCITLLSPHFCLDDSPYVRLQGSTKVYEA